MKFIDPSLEEVFQTLVNNDHIINFLKEKKLLITKKDLKRFYTNEDINNMSQYIYLNNVETLYSVSEILLENKEIIKNNSIAYLVSKKIAWDDITKALKVSVMSEEIYKNIIFTYKYCYVSSFFQNNKDMFIPENDFFEMEKNPAAMAFYDAVMKEFDKLDDILSNTLKYLNFNDIPWDTIAYLTQLLGFEKSTFKLDNEEKKFREIAKNILDIYRIKGTDYSFKIFFNFLGFDIDIHEYYFDRRMFYYNYSGNLETDTINKEEYLYYLTSNNPSENTLEDISTNEIVYPSDITEQYSLEEFNFLVKKYGLEAVLGYSLSDKFGEEYKDKVYKYFKTNHVYYEIYPIDGKLTSDKVLTINRCLDFLTPSYILRRATKTEAKTSETDDPISFDGDGSKLPDKNGNFEGGIEILDDEDWDNFGQDMFLENSNGNLVWKNNGKKYYNSLYNDKNAESKEVNKFRIPINTRWSNRSLSRFLTGGLKTPYITNRVLKHYTKDGKDYIAPYLFNGQNTEYTYGNMETPLVGKNSIKEYIKNKEIPLNVKIVNSINDTNLKELKYYPTLNRTLIKVMSSLNLKDLEGFPVSNSNTEYPEERKLLEYYNPSNKEICSSLVFGKYCICINDKNYILYRYGNYNYPRNENEKALYLNSFNYELVEEINFSDKETEPIVDYLKIDSRKNKEELESLIKETKNEIALGKKDLNYISDRLYYATEEKIYYKAIKVTNIDNSLFNNTFLNIEDANNDNDKYLNKEAKINNKLYCCKYANINENDLLYSKEDNCLYYVDEFFNFKKYEDFFGNIKIEIDDNGKSTCKLYAYDEAWKGYDEQADYEDFLMYNSDHKITWPNINIFDKKIGRPIKQKTDLNYSNELFENLLADFCSTTYNNFTDDEDTNMSAIIRNGFNDLNLSYEIFESYSLEDFLKDFYKIVLKKDYSLDNFSEEFKNEYKPGKNGYTSEQQAEIKSCFDKVINDIKIYNNALINSNGRDILDKEDPQYKGEYYNIYEEFNTLLNIYNSVLNIDNFFKYYYYNKLVHLYREKFIEDDESNIDVNDVRRTLITPSAYVRYDGSSGKYLMPHILNTSYKTNNEGKDVSIRIYFNKVSYEENVLKLYSTIQDVYNAFGYLPSKQDFYNRVLKPTFYVKDKSFYNNKKLTNWQKEKNRFNKFYSSAEIVKLGNEIIISISGKESLNNFDKNELNNLEGYLEINNLEGNFIDTNISYPASFDWIKKDYNQVPSEFVSYGNDREYNYDIKYNKGIKFRSCINKDKKIVIKIKKTDINYNKNIKQIILE